MNFHEYGRLRNEILTDAAYITITTPMEQRVASMLEIHRLVSDALAAEGVLLPCHEDNERGQQ